MFNVKISLFSTYKVYYTVKKLVGLPAMTVGLCLYI